MKNLIKVDFLVLTAIDDEFLSVRAAFDADYSAKSIEESHIGRVYRVTINSKRRKLIGIIASPGRIGRISSAIFTTYLLGKFDPKYIALTGIAGGFRHSTEVDRYGREHGEELYLGDLVFADCIIDIDMGKIIDSEYINYNINSELHMLERPRIHTISSEIIKKFQSFTKMKSKYLVGSRSISRVHFAESGYPNSHIGSILSTEVVVASEFDAKRIARRAVSFEPHRYPIAVEMEGSGVAQAVELVSAGSNFFLIKAINDYADSGKSRDEVGTRSVALENSAIVTRNFIEYLLSN